MCEKILQIIWLKVIVTALRLIEREEKSDAECAQRHRSTGFLPKGRPKKWKQMGMDVRL